MISEKKYLTCPHLSRSVINEAVKIIRRCPKRKGSHVCAECEFVGYLHDESFRQHFYDSNHKFCLKVNTPTELFCFECGDCEFCSYLDHERRRQNLFHKKTGGVPDNNPFGKACKISARGLVNMGSTCFMNSVVQILSRNTFLTTSCSQFCHYPDYCSIIKSRRSDGDMAASSDSMNSNETIISCIPCCEFKFIADNIK